jgi:hypothetical protein
MDSSRRMSGFGNSPFQLWAGVAGKRGGQARNGDSVRWLGGIRGRRPPIFIRIYTRETPSRRGLPRIEGRAPEPARPPLSLPPLSLAPFSLAPLDQPHKPSHVCAGRITREIPLSIRSKLDTSRLSRLRPAGVILYTRILRFPADKPHSAPTQPAFNMRCKAGYNEPSSICSRLADVPFMSCANA